MQPDPDRDALLIIDVQNDFCPGGALAVAGGDRVVDPINRIAPLFAIVVLTQDWHPRGHVSFASSWPGKAPYESIEVDGLEQGLWPDHCIAGGAGAAFHPRLAADRASLILRKGTRKGLDSYSAFLENDRKSPTGLEGALKGLGIRRIWAAGLATDYCVKYSVLDALALGFEAILLEDAIAAVDFPAGSAAAAIDAMRDAGARIARAADLAVALAGAQAGARAEAPAKAPAKADA